MNLYLISQTDNNDWDTYDSAVVAAETMEQAQRLHPDSLLPEQDRVTDTWTTPENVKVELIGTAKPNTKEGVICASFNAG